MTNPYTPPVTTLPTLSVVGRELPASPTPLGHLARTFCFAIGCTLGLHLGVAFGEGFDTAIQRSARNPLNAVMFFAVLSLACLSIMAVWKLFRRYFVGRYVATCEARFAAGIFLTLLFYAVVYGSERLVGRDFLGPPNSVRLWLFMAAGFLLTILCTVEFEACWTRLRTRSADPLK